MYDAAFEQLTVISFIKDIMKKKIHLRQKPPFTYSVANAGIKNLL